MHKRDFVRTGYAILYFITSIINFSIGLNNPEILRSLSEYALIPHMGDILSVLPTWAFQAGLFLFSGYQVMLLLLLLSKGIFVQLGMLGGILFHLSILPFGWFNLPNILFMAPLLFLVDREYDTSIPGILLFKFKSGKRKQMLKS